LNAEGRLTQRKTSAEVTLENVESR
jgi:hypothetical protein